MQLIKVKSNVVRYIIFTYVLCWLMIFSLGGIATLVLDGTPLVMQFLTAIVSWSPTIVLLVMFKKLYPNSSVNNFYRKCFSEKLNLRLLLVTFLIQLLIFMFSIYIIAIQLDFTVMSLLDLSISTILPAIFFTLIQGAVGEESGWRGYLQPAIEEKFGVIIGSLVVGLIWTFFHAPLWFLTTGYNGVELIKYIVMFSICITSVGVIIGICYHHCKNLFVPIWIHFMLNFYTELFKGNLIDLVSIFALCYLITAFALLYWHIISLRKQHKSSRLYKRKS
ncbi:CPBP family intramembrane glutamic endopeptidase [Vallitalea okinawensis]|uniref:CPBP family intramembrane glutamic endopeptidase n=1 Tax=Vallitalea okinawensis TaxID=2078660 RepID=UPI000CFDA8DA|nr:type II CAAX endopeptidase family protein [Vallitalea okinawensis]